MSRKVVAGLISLSICLSSALSFEGQPGFEEVENELMESPRSSVTMVDVIQRIYSECMAEGSFSCVKPKILSFLSTSVKNGDIHITRELSISPKNDVVQEVNSKHDSEGFEGVKTADMILLKRLDRFLSTHELKMVIPEQLRFIPGFLKQLPKEVKVPLDDSASFDGGVEEGRSRGFMKKVVLPFLLALKFKVSALIPLAITLIALKAWKALTLGILSIVLSTVLILFKIAKPKEMNYEIVHYPAVEHYHAHGRSLDADGLAYRSYRGKEHNE